ncbi:hypothetical protein Rhopal_004391-T1 [Rhodotorula paludigena]|uniref:K Homology domain-containing protein n=1 Tax=Rhodotorula paludigena TaxID=86838 RepID=A0AAV5GFN4_9BASI|nr:hypothetical protein Rhopal_004391-T1 [Rhodotorula paludigena]
MQVLLPGDLLPSSSSASSSSLHLGPGLSTSTATAAAAKGKGKERADVAATRAGLLGHLEQGDKERWWIEGTLKRVKGYRVDIGSSQAASLDALAFEGATKRNKPNLKVGTLVYAHLLSTPSFSEPELSCVDPATQKAAGFGELQGGFLIRGVELGRCRALLAPKNPILSTLGARFPFEVAVGMNGRVWVKAAQEDDDEQLVDVIRELRGR